MNPLKGITLAEVLIGLVLLGVVAAFTIPKILVSQGEARKKAVFKETYSELSRVLNEGMITRKIKASNFQAYFLSRLNTIKVCPTNYVSQGCYVGSVSGIVDDDPAAGVQLANGATIVDIDDYVPGRCYDWVIVDWNGKAAPNDIGDDVMFLAFSCERRAYTHTVGGTIQPGQVIPSQPYPGNTALFNEMITR